MDRAIDCLLIGHNQTKFTLYEQTVREMGLNSGAYRDLNQNMIRYNNRQLSAADTFNLFCSDDQRVQPIKRVESFNAAIAYLGTYLSRRGLTFDYVNSFQDEKEELSEKLQHERFRVAAIITTLYVTPTPIIEIIDFIREYNQEVKIVVGGPFVSTRVRTLEVRELDYLLDSIIGADYYVNSSQGETALVKIIQAQKNGSPQENINNIYYREGGKYVSTPILKEENKLSDNMVNWDLFADRVGEFVNVRTAISCPFSCAFCGFPRHAGEYQTAGVAGIEAELNRLHRIKTVKSLLFVDDTFNIPVKRFKEILRMMVRNKYNFKWNANFRCQFADRETLELMKESGCQSVFLGIESGNDQILKNMNKAVKVEAYLKGIALLKEFAIPTFGSFIIGFPGESPRTAEDTIKFINESDLDFSRAHLWYCEPITPVWQEREKYGLRGESFEWSHDTMDSKTACHIIEQMILSIREPVRFPQYYFDYDTVMQLTHKGFTLDQVKQFLMIFNDAVREKLPASSRKEVSFDIVMRLRKLGSLRE
jgi:radical SAM PhpK family P-methyltransferase